MQFTKGTVLFVAKYAYKLFFLDGNFRGAHHFWGDPYLNGTTILFDKKTIQLLSEYLQPYHAESTCSRPITEVKQRWAGLVLQWVTTWEYTLCGRFFSTL